MQAAFESCHVAIHQHQHFSKHRRVRFWDRRTRSFVGASAFGFDVIRRASRLKFSARIALRIAPEVGLNVKGKATMNQRAGDRNLLQYTRAILLRTPCLLVVLPSACPSSVFVAAPALIRCCQSESESALASNSRHCSSHNFSSRCVC